MKHIKLLATMTFTIFLNSQWAQANQQVQEIEVVFEHFNLSKDHAVSIDEYFMSVIHNE